jgi:hypothetical protein
MAKLRGNTRTFKVKGKREISCKRMYLDGLVVRTDCPKCGEEVERDVGSEYLSYPEPNVPFDFTFVCRSEGPDGCLLPDDTGDGYEFSVRAILRMSLEIEDEYYSDSETPDDGRDEDEDKPDDGA